MRIIYILAFFSLLLQFRGTTFAQQLHKDFLMGKIRYADDSLFVKLRSEHANKSAYLQKEVYSQYIKMHDAALKNGVKLIITSGARNFYLQKYLWELKWNNKHSSKFSNLELRSAEILKWLAAPGTSRHHWGTDLDFDTYVLGDLQNEAWKKAYKWLKGNAHRFGFFQPYGAGRHHGYKEEPWHWSYTPLADHYLKAYQKTVSCVDIYGFQGAASTLGLNLVQNYVTSVNPSTLSGLSCYGLSIYR